jgi:[acyl-carrier-protein] S-malonyltransferase
VAARPEESTASAAVAVVGGRPISIARLEQRLAEVRRGPRGRQFPPERGSESAGMRRWIVQELVTDEVLVQEARAAGIIGAQGTERGPSEPPLSASDVARLVDLVAAAATVPERDIRAYYERNRDLFRRRPARRVRHILVRDESTARRLAARLAAGGAWHALAEARSIDRGSRTRGGDLGDVHRGEFAGPLEEAIFDAEVGAVVGPIQTEHGWHIVRVDAVTEESVVPYAEARPVIEADLLAASRIRMFEAWLEGRRAALAVIEPGFEHPAHPVHGVPTHRH